jgi:hypothetical protein
MFGKLLVGGAVVVLAATACAAEPKNGDSYIKVEVQGTLETGIAAIGGETTGVIVKTKDGTLELDLGKDKELRAQADKLNGQAVVVTGSLSVRKGVEVAQRLIVTVGTLKPADDKKK